MLKITAHRDMDVVSKEDLSLAKENDRLRRDYQKILRQHGFKVSMSGKGNCYDNVNRTEFAEG